MDKIVIFGCGPTGLRTYELLKEEKKIIAFLDNDSEKAGNNVENVPVYLPDAKVLNDLDYDYIIIASVYGDRQIREQLHKMGVADNKMIDHPDTPNMLPAFLQNLSEDFAEENVVGACAEVGVFRGVNAREINCYFPDKQLHLFDTFEGFAKKDIEYEHLVGRKDAAVGQFADTTVDIVMENMKYPECVVIHKGFFPDTAQGLDEKFCFVRIDMDLYAPTEAALEIFSPLMVREGVILVHDYFGGQYPGIKKVVRKFMEQHPKLRKIPIADTMTIAITGF